MSVLSEFREFAVKGNVIDLAVGVIIGGAFGKIVDSLVNDLIMPVVGAATGGLDFSNYFIPLAGQTVSFDFNGVIPPVSAVTEHGGGPSATHRYVSIAR